MDIVLATRNKKKLEELRRICSGLDVSFLTLDSFPGCPEVIEDGRTFRQNAVKKAEAVCRHTGLPALADDSGLEVSALKGAPGVFSSRFAGDTASDEENVRKLLRDLESEDDRSARFVCCVAFVLPDGTKKTFTGTVAGTIGRRQRGWNGFGYDPVFSPAGHSRTFAEMGDEEKDSMSHRGAALKKLYTYLRRLP